MQAREEISEGRFLRKQWIGDVGKAVVDLTGVGDKRTALHEIPHSYLDSIVAHAVWQVKRQALPWVRVGIIPA